MSDTKILSRDDILQADDLPKQLEEVPEWGGAVYVRSLTGTERDSFEASVLKFKQNGKGMTRETVLENMRAKLLVRCLVDADGNRYFADGEVAKLGGKAAKPLDRLFSVAQKINGLTEEDVEELVGNSVPDPNDTSTSTSASGSGSPTPVTSSGR